MSDWAEVKENTKVGEGVYHLRLAAPAIAAQAKPGQFVMLRVSHGLDPLLARPFSIHGVEGEDLLILYKVVGKGTRLLSLKRPGGKTLSLWGPLGKGFDLNVQRPVLVAGGMGIAPLAFVAQELERQGKDVAFLCGLPGMQGFEGLASHLSGLAMATSGRISISWATEDGSAGHNGLVTGLLAQTLEAGSASTRSVLACGPMPMLKAVASICAEHKVPCQVSLEAPMACGLGACLGCVIPAADGGYLRACQEGPVLKAELVDWARL